MNCLASLMLILLHQLPSAFTCVDAFVITLGDTLDNIMASLLTICLGAIGWWVTHFFFEPLREILSLRRQTLELLTRFNCGPQGFHKNEWKETQEAARRIGIGLMAHHHCAYWWVKFWYERIQHYNIFGAGVLLWRLSGKDGNAFLDGDPIRSFLNFPHMDCIREYRELDEILGYNDFRDAPHERRPRISHRHA